MTVADPQNPPPLPTPSALRASLHEQGYVVIRSLLRPAQLAELQDATRRTTEFGRSGKWPHVRTVGKQFPPWDPADAVAKGIWGVQGLLNPDLGGDSLVFARGYFCDEVLDVVKALLGGEGGGDETEETDVEGACAQDDDLVLELYNLLVNPPTPFALRWHRDDIPDTATAEEELERLGVQPVTGKQQQDRSKKRRWRHYYHTQYNLSLTPNDTSLVVVPGSHARARTQAEREADPLAPELPGQVVVRLNAGDVVFYDNNILHRGVYDSGVERMALHGSVGHVRAGQGRARNVLQHGVRDYVEKVDFGAVFAGLGEEEEEGDGKGKEGRERQRARAEKMREKLVKLGRESGDVGYSLTG